MTIVTALMKTVAEQQTTIIFQPILNVVLAYVMLRVLLIVSADQRLIPVLKVYPAAQMMTVMTSMKIVVVQQMIIIWQQQLNVDLVSVMQLAHLNV